MEQLTQRPEGVRVKYRRMKFDFESGFDRYWHSGSAFKSFFWTQLSTSFDPGERFFIEAARAMKKMTSDPVLLAEVAEFCRQEGHHSAQHLKFDRLNERMGIDVASCRERYERVLDGVARAQDPELMLAVTCALEHFTSGIADMFLNAPEISAGGDPRVIALWKWHAAEELEHRATCFDLYTASGGRYRPRVMAMIVSWNFLIYTSLANTLRLVKQDGKLFTLDTLAGLYYLFGRRGLLTRMLPAFLTYFKSTFHPWEGHDGKEIARWQEANERYIANLEQLRAPRAVSN